MIEDAEVVLIDDEWSHATAEEYAAALAAWMADVRATEPIHLPVTAAETLHELRDHTATPGLGPGSGVRA